MAAKTFLCQSLGMGIGMGLVFVPTAIVPLHHFKRQRGLAMGIAIGGGSFGGMIFPIGKCSYYSYIHACSLSARSSTVILL